MELKDFIKQTVKDYSESIIELRNELNGQKIIIEPERKAQSKQGRGPSTPQSDILHKIDFDVAVAGTNNHSPSKINVYNPEERTEDPFGYDHQHLSRLRFSIHVSTPESKRSDSFDKDHDGEITI